MNGRHLCVVAASVVLFLVMGAQKPEKRELTWVQDTFEDFKDGRFDASGANLYVTRSGWIKTINRFDLNGDGNLDLVFNSSHDEVKVPTASYYELPTDRRSGIWHELPARGTTCAAVADLNHDGFPDSVFCPNDDGVSIRRYLSIFWGGKDGWSPRRMTGLIAIAPRAVQIADLDGDSWPEIIVLNANQVLRVYWGGKDGYRQDRFKDLKLTNAQDFKVQDFDGDGRPDVVVVQRDPAQVLIFWNDGMSSNTEWPTPFILDLQNFVGAKLAIADYDGDGRPDLFITGGSQRRIGFDPTTGETRFRYSGLRVIPQGNRIREWGVLRNVPAPASSSLCVADLDRDGRADIVLTDSGASKDSVRILWGDRGGRFDGPPTILPLGYASATATADLDGDGAPDLVVGTSRSEATWESKSRVFYGDGKRAFKDAELAIATADVTAVVIAPGKTGNGHRLVFCNNRGGRTTEDVPISVYWGGKSGFDPERLSRFSIRSGYASAAADLNDDGYVDLILLSIVHAVREQHPGLGFNILWGGKDGLRDDRRTVVKEYGLYSVSVADVNRDGYLDLIANARAASPAGDPPRVVIWFGGPEGFDARHRVVLPCPGIDGQNTVGDFNNDGYLDIAAACERAHRVAIFWGGKEGFNTRNQTSLPILAPTDVKTADLDKDGYLDLIVSTHRFPGAWRFDFPGTMEYDFGTYIFWGGPQGFHTTNSQRLPAHSGIGITVADFDGDGYLDLYVPSYHFGVTRESMASYLYWGGPSGFLDLNRTELTVDASHGSMAADFNGDGRIDLAVCAHSKNGTHDTKSKVFYSDGHRFAHPDFVELPTIGPHYMQRADVGNTFDRSYQQTYMSPVFTWDGPWSHATLMYRADLPGRSRLEFAVRFAKSKAEMDARPWIKLGATSKSGFDLDADARCLQYRAVLISDNGDRYPALDRVEVVFSREREVAHR